MPQRLESHLQMHRQVHLRGACKVQGERSAGKKTPLFGTVLCQKLSFYHDRLGTNIGKVQKKVMRLLQSQDNITYSPKYGLELHVFAPPASDRRSKRPAMVMIHGGGFKNGNRNDKAGIIGWSKQLAMRGFVCVSIGAENASFEPVSYQKTIKFTKIGSGQT